MKGLEEAPHLAASGRTSFAADPSIAKGFYRAAGYRVCGERVVRVDILERLADLIRPAIAYKPGVSVGDPPAGAADGEGFVVYCRDDLAHGVRGRSLCIDPALARLCERATSGTSHYRSDHAAAATQPIVAPAVAEAATAPQEQNVEPEEAVTASAEAAASESAVAERSAEQSEPAAETPAEAAAPTAAESPPGRRSRNCRC